MKKDTRQHIIETASTLFYNNGYNLTGINEIISEAGIAKATLYSHFKSKEDICIAYLQFKNTTFLNEIAPFCEAKQKGIDSVLAIFDFLEAFFQQNDFNGCWCIRTVSEIPKENVKIKTVIQQQKIDFLAFIEKLIGNNLDNNNEKEIKELAEQCYLLYESAVSESHLHQKKWPITAAKKISLKLIS